MKKDNNAPTIDKNGKAAAEWFSKKHLLSNSDKIWTKIAEKLENVDKKILSWFMVVTTSFTMLVAAGLQYVDQSDDFYQHTEDDLVVAQVTQDIPDLEVIIEDSVFQKIYLKSVEKIPVAKLIRDTIAYELIDTIKNIMTTSTIGDPKRGKGIPIKISAQAHYLNSKVLPGVGVSFKVWQKTVQSWSSVH